MPNMLGSLSLAYLCNKSFAPAFREVVNAAANFNKVVLVLEKK